MSQVDEVYNYVAYLVAMLPCCFAMHMVRRSHMAKHKLFADLDPWTFELEGSSPACS